MLGVNQAWEWELQLLNVVASLVESSADNRQDFSAGGLELRVLTRQLPEVPTAERSIEAPEED